MEDPRKQYDDLMTQVDEGLYDGDGPEDVEDVDQVGYEDEGVPEPEEEEEKAEPTAFVSTSSARPASSSSR